MALANRGYITRGDDLSQEYNAKQQSNMSRLSALLFPTSLACPRLSQPVGVVVLIRVTISSSPVSTKTVPDQKSFLCVPFLSRLSNFKLLEKFEPLDSRRSNRRISSTDRYYIKLSAYLHDPPVSISLPNFHPTNSRNPSFTLQSLF